uniref:(northern house mosquito) hypothetical protein n=1 Tax=Culex pipiens TaxID=7175 RepID=A0A8D8EWZ2_CULPI
MIPHANQLVRVLLRVKGDGALGLESHRAPPVDGAFAFAGCEAEPVSLVGDEAMVGRGVGVREFGEHSGGKRAVEGDVCGATARVEGECAGGKVSAWWHVVVVDQFGVVDGAVRKEVDGAAAETVGRAAPDAAAVFLLVVDKVAPPVVDEYLFVFVVEDDFVAVGAGDLFAGSYGAWFRGLLFGEHGEGAALGEGLLLAARLTVDVLDRAGDQTVLGHVLFQVLRGWMRVDKVFSLCDGIVRHEERPGRTVTEHGTAVGALAVLGFVLEVVPVALVDQELSLLATLDQLEVGGSDGRNRWRFLRRLDHAHDRVLQLDGLRGGIVVVRLIVKVKELKGGLGVQRRRTVDGLFVLEHAPPVEGSLRPGVTVLVVITLVNGDLRRSAILPPATFDILVVRPKIIFLLTLLFTRNSLLDLLQLDPPIHQLTNRLTLNLPTVLSLLARTLPNLDPILLDLLQPILEVLVDQHRILLLLALHHLVRTRILVHILLQVRTRTIVHQPGTQRIPCRRHHRSRHLHHLPLLQLLRKLPMNLLRLLGRLHHSHLHRVNLVRQHNFMMGLVRLRRRMDVVDLVVGFEQPTPVAAHLDRASVDAARPVPLGQAAARLVAPQEAVRLEDQVVRVAARLDDLEAGVATVQCKVRVRRALAQNQIAQPVVQELLHLARLLDGRRHRRQRRVRLVPVSAHRHGSGRWRLRQRRPTTTADAVVSVGQSQMLPVGTLESTLLLRLLLWPLQR